SQGGGVKNSKTSRRGELNSQWRSISSVADGPGNTIDPNSAFPEETASSANITATTVFTLHSRPNSSNVVFLDFDGHVIQDTAWNETTNPLIAEGFDTDGDPSSISSSEADKIFDIWLRVSEDLAPFDIDVTTEEPDSFGSTTGRILITRDVDANGAAMPWQGSGGVAYVNVWGRADYEYFSPAMVYYNNLGNGYAKYVGEAASHELGHNFGLSHDGTSSDAYYFGHGEGPTSWAPIMGAGYNREMSQWSKGEYVDANQLQDDLAIISAKLTYRPDDRGNTFATASPLLVEDSGEVQATDPESDPGNLFPGNKGVIERNTDVDVFYFDAGDGEVNLTIAPVRPQITANLGTGNLDINATLYDELNTPVLQSVPTGDAKATLSSIVAPGRYYVMIKGDGDTTVPYSAYGSLGQYFIAGTIPAKPGDTAPPLPNPMTFSSPPSPAGQDRITMTAALATDDSGGTVWDYFECTSSGQQGCGNSGWQTSRTYTASGLTQGSQYGFHVKARDAEGNQTAWSATLSSTTSLSEMHIDQVALTLKKAGRKQIYARATIIIRDKNGLAVPSAQVHVNWFGAVLGSDSGTTNEQGTVIFSSSAVPRYANTEFRISVDDVSHSNFDYDAASNTDDDACIVTLKRNDYRQCE
ncbi:MAG: zinc-dependent metalloprotease family protein, partial [Pseudomonadota bacterium]